MVHRDRIGYIYLLHHPDGILKIGFSTSLRNRISTLRNPANTPVHIRKGVEISVVGVIPRATFDDEQSLHARFSHLIFGRYKCEWYSDSSEIRSYFAKAGAFCYAECECGSWTWDGICVDRLGKHQRWAISQAGSHLSEEIAPEIEWPEERPDDSDRALWNAILQQAPKEVIRSVAASHIASHRNYKISEASDPKVGNERKRQREKAANYRARNAKGASALAAPIG